MISTCNRLEIYADVDRFHGSVEELSRLLVERAGEAAEAMLPHLYVHYDDGAVSHLFQVAAGLDSMAVGEGQILGQTREALRARPGARHRRARRSTCSSSRRCASASARAPRPTSTAPPRPWSPPRWPARTPRSASWPASGSLVVGAGAMAGLATATVVRLGAGERHRRQPQPRPGRPARRGVRRPPGAAVRARRRARARRRRARLRRRHRRCWSPSRWSAAARPDARPMSIIDLALPARRRPGRRPRCPASP